MRDALAREANATAALARAEFEAADREAMLEAKIRTGSKPKPAEKVPQRLALCGTAMIRLPLMGSYFVY